MKCSCMTLFRALFPTILVSTIAQPQLLLANPLSPPSGSYEITARLELPYLVDGAWTKPRSSVCPTPGVLTRFPCLW